MDYQVNAIKIADLDHGKHNTKNQDNLECDICGI